MLATTRRRRAPRTRTHSSWRRKATPRLYGRAPRLLTQEQRANPAQLLDPRRQLLDGRLQLLLGQAGRAGVCWRGRGVWPRAPAGCFCVVVVAVGPLACARLTGIVPHVHKGVV
jgi:hypothetical protein